MIRRKDQMMFEPAPTGIEHLETMLKAIEEGRTVQFDYQSYYSNEPARAWEVIPCFLCIFEGRWYPLHESQEEIETAAEYSVFTYYVRPSFDFFQRVLWMREKVEIIAPDDVRTEMAKIVGQLSEMYR